MMSTATSEQATSVLYPDSTYRTLDLIFYIISLSAVACWVSDRTRGFREWDFRSPVQLCTLLVLVDSWLFLAVSAVLLLGVGASFNAAACSLVSWLCIMFYGISKLFLYLFLTERVNIVARETLEGRKPRFASNWYKGAIVLLSLWVVALATGIADHRAVIDSHTDRCFVEFRKLYGLIIVVAVDVIVNVYLTFAFVVPIRKSNMPRVRHLAVISMISSGVALVTSVTNILTATLMIRLTGHEVSFVCLFSCGADVVINAGLLHCLTVTKPSDRVPSSVPIAQVVAEVANFYPGITVDTERSVQLGDPDDSRRRWLNTRESHAPFEEKDPFDTEVHLCDR